MKLYIDTSDTEKTIIGLDRKRFETVSKKEKSQLLLSFIESKLINEKKTMSDLTEIEVSTGPGSFTGLKIGVSVANAMGFALKIPVNKVRIDKGGIVDINYER